MLFFLIDVFDSTTWKPSYQKHLLSNWSSSREAGALSPPRRYTLQDLKRSARPDRDIGTIDRDGGEEQWSRNLT